jgi:hypothetical protein
MEICSIRALNATGNDRLTRRLRSVAFGLAVLPAFWQPPTIFGKSR